MGASTEQVEQITKIRKSFVEAFEQDDYKTLPPSVYVNAYAKALCELYEINSEKTSLILQEIKKKNSSCSISEDIIHNLEEEKQINHEEEIKLKRLTFLIATICILFIATMVIGGYLLFRTTNDSIAIMKSEESSGSHISTVRFDGEKLNVFITPQFVPMIKMKVPEGK